MEFRSMDPATIWEREGKKKKKIRQAFLQLFLHEPEQESPTHPAVSCESSPEPNSSQALRELHFPGQTDTDLAVCLLGITHSIAALAAHHGDRQRLLFA